MRSNPVGAPDNTEKNQHTDNQEHFTTGHVPRRRAFSAPRRHSLVELQSAPENQQQRPPTGKHTPHFKARMRGVHEQYRTHQDPHTAAQNSPTPPPPIPHP